MSSKYGTIRSNTWVWTHEQGNPRMSDHVLTDTWDRRTPPGSCSPEHAWENGVDVSFMSDAFADKGGQVPEEARFWSEKTEWGTYDVVLLVTNQTVRTVYRVDSIQDETVRSALYGLRGLIEDE